MALLTKFIRSISNTKLFIICTSFLSILGRFQNNILRKKQNNLILTSYVPVHLLKKIVRKGQQTVEPQATQANDKSHCTIR